LDKKKLTIICVIVGAVLLVVAAVAIIVPRVANRPKPYIEPTQPPVSYETPASFAPEQTQPAPAAPSFTVTPQSIAPPAPIDVATAFPGASVKEAWVDNQWILSIPAGWSVTIPACWIANTDPRRWTIDPMPAGYTGASGEILPAGTTMRATLAGDIYVRYVG